MCDTFSNFSFAIFFYNDIHKIADIIVGLFKEELSEEKAYIREGNFNITNYIDSFFVQCNKDMFSFWTKSDYPQWVFFTSNSTDGRYTLCNAINNTLKCPLYLLKICNETVNINPGYSFQHIDKYNQERVILAYKEDKWVFYERGKPLSIEETNLYKRRIIKERMNGTIIINYLKKLGIDFYQIDKNIKESFTFERIIG